MGIGGRAKKKSPTTTVKGWSEGGCGKSGVRMGTEAKWRDAGEAGRVMREGTCVKLLPWLMLIRRRKE